MSDVQARMDAVWVILPTTHFVVLSPRFYAFAVTFPDAAMAPWHDNLNHRRRK